MNSSSNQPAPFDRSRPVVVLAGGDSAEREISLKSGRAVLAALDRERVDARMVDVRDQSVTSVAFRDREVAFVALHGSYGEDGHCQRDLEASRVPYTGCGIKASRLAFDKTASRRAAREAGLTVAEGIVWRLGEEVPKVELPVVVKPASQGSSVGLAYVDRSEELELALNNAAASGEVLVEQFVSGEEWTVAVFQGRVFPPVRVEHAGPLFDHSAKYESNDSRFSALEDRSDPRFDTLTLAADVAWRAFGATGLVRVDFILTFQQRGPGVPVFLEMNTIPGLTERSLAPIAAAAAGVTFGSLCLLMLADAVEQFEKRCGP